MAAVLVADDDDDMRLILRIALESQGHRVTPVTNGDDALEACLTGRFDLALLDVTMPGLEGPEVVSRVRQDPVCHGLPILLVSGNALFDDIERGLAAGADDYVTKPFQTFELQRRVERMVWIGKDLEAPEERHRVRAAALAAVARLRR